MSIFWGTAVLTRLTDQLIDRITAACMPDSRAGQLVPGFFKTDVDLSRGRLLKQRRVLRCRSMQMNFERCLRT